MRTHARVLRREAVLGIQHRLGPGPAGAQFGGLRFQLLDGEPAHERGGVHKALFVAAEEIARDLAAGGLVGRGTDERAELGVERNGGLGQEMPHRIGLDVGAILDLAPDGELRRSSWHMGCVSSRSAMR